MTSMPSEVRCFGSVIHAVCAQLEFAVHLEEMEDAN